MKRVFLVIFLFFGILNARDEMLLGFTKNKIFNYTRVDGAVDLVKDFVSNLGHKKGMDVKVIFFDTDEELMNSFKNKKIDAAAVNTYEFSKLKPNMDDISLNTLWSLSFWNENGEKYCSIKSKKSVNKKLKDMVVSISKNPHLYYWFDAITLEKYKKSINKVYKRVKKIKKESTSILDVYFGKSDMAIVSKANWNTMLELNPAIKQNILLEKCSKINFPLFVGFFRKSTDLKQQKGFISIVLNMKEVDKNNTIFNLINFNHFYKIDYKNLKKVDKFFKKYEELKQKYR